MCYQSTNKRLMTTLEERVTSLETELRHLASKEDLAKLETRLIKWMIGAVATSTLLASAIVATIDRLIG